MGHVGDRVELTSMRLGDDDERQPVDNNAVEFNGPVNVTCWHFADRQQTLRISEWSGVLYSSLKDDGDEGGDDEDGE